VVVERQVDNPVLIGWRFRLCPRFSISLQQLLSFPESASPVSAMATASCGPASKITSDVFMLRNASYREALRVLLLAIVTASRPGSAFGQEGMTRISLLVASIRAEQPYPRKS
jgi:hypothetical protein